MHDSDTVTAKRKKGDGTLYQAVAAFSRKYRFLSRFLLALVVVGAVFTGIAAGIQWTTPGEIPLSYLMSHVRSGHVYLSLNDGSVVDLGLARDFGSDLRGCQRITDSTSDGQTVVDTPAGRYDFEIDTRTTPSLRIPRNVTIAYAADTGALYAPEYRKEWCTMPPGFQRRMRTLRAMLPRYWSSPYGLLCKDRLSGERVLREPSLRQLLSPPLHR